MSDALKIGIAGLGTVGVGTVKVLQAHAGLLESRCTRPLEITAVSARDKTRDRGVSLDGYRWFDDPLALAKSDDVDVVVELMGGADGIAKQFCETAIENGKHVVTANKALLAEHGNTLAGNAEAKGVSLCYEAAVAGGIPIIKALREGLAANGISRVYGILNGTCNYILSAMGESGREFEEILLEAQELGYAEADPGFDVDGVDTAHKLAILTAVAFGCQPNFGAIHIEGIRHVSPLDIRLAKELGYVIKLLGIARLTDAGVEQRVHPCMVRSKAPIATVRGVYNAVVADGDFVESTMFEGQGAGEGPTASAVVADIVDIARGCKVPTFSVPSRNLMKLPPAPMERHIGPYYVRLMVVDRPGVFAEIAASLADHDVSMEAVLQRQRSPGGAVPVVLTTHDTEEAAMRHWLGEVEKLDAVVEAPRVIRIEPL